MAAARKTNWFAILVSVAVVAVLVGISAAVVAFNNSNADATPSASPSAATINTETGAIVIGSGEQTMDTYLDFMCPVCNQFERIYGEAITELINDGTITLNLHPISILDRLSQGTQYSTRSANAMYCVAANVPAASLQYMQALFVNQPPEGSTGLTDEQLLRVAENVGVTGIDACVTGGEYIEYVTTMTAKTPVAPGASGIGTPTIAINGEVIANSSLPDPSELRTLFE